MFPLNLGGGLELRLIEEQHAEELFSVVERNRRQLREWLPWVDRTLSPEEPRRFIIQTLAQHATREALTCAIFLEGALVGSIGLHQIAFLNRNPSIGYWLDSSFQGRGIITRACRAIVTLGFAEYGLHRIEIRCASGNLKSCAVPRRLGFVREGVMREAQWVGGRYLDLVIWGMLAQDWKAEDGAP